MNKLRGINCYVYGVMERKITNFCFSVCWSRLISVEYVKKPRGFTHSDPVRFQEYYGQTRPDVSCSTED